MSRTRNSHSAPSASLLRILPSCSPPFSVILSEAKDPCHRTCSRGLSRSSYYHRRVATFFACWAVVMTLCFPPQATAQMGTSTPLPLKEREKAEISFQTLVEQIPAVIYRVVPGDQSGFSYLYVSPQSEWILGMPHAEFLNNPDMLITRIHPLDKKSVMEEIKSCWQEQRSFCFEYRIFHSDGRVLWFHDEAVLVRNKAGLPLYYQGILTDITQMKETEKELRQAHDTLEVRVQERTEELEAFTSSISHDLRGPIWMLDRYIQMIVDDYGGKLEPDLKSRLGTIAKTVNQMDRLIDALLHLSRVNRTELSITPLDLKKAGRPTHR